MTAALLRLRQGVRALTAWVRPVDDQAAAAYLSPRLLALFRQMRPGERQHSLNVLHTLLARGETHPALLTAALLHDCGKVRTSYWLWERAIVVIVKRLAPGRALKWGIGEPTGWRRPFVVNRQHPAWGAAMAQAAGADPLTVELIAGHQRKIDRSPSNELERLLVTLQVADDLN
ncbi:MAG: HD domain-containing protein [Aggregatilineales bacterium]